MKQVCKSVSKYYLLSSNFCLDSMLSYIRARHELGQVNSNRSCFISHLLYFMCNISNTLIMGKLWNGPEPPTDIVLVRFT